MAITIQPWMILLAEYKKLNVETGCLFVTQADIVRKKPRYGGLQVVSCEPELIEEVIGKAFEISDGNRTIAVTIQEVR